MDLVVRRRWFGWVKRVLWRVGRSVLTMYLLVVLVISTFQAKLIFPGASSQGLAESVVSPLAGAALVEMRGADGTKVIGLFGRALTAGGAEETAAVAKGRPTVLWFYGNAMCMNDALLEFKQFRQLGANVMLVDYEGFGMSGGTASEAGCYGAAEAAYAHLLGRADVDVHKIVPGGWSLGGAVAIEVARRHAGEGHVCGLMTFCTFTSMAELGRWHYPGFPVKIFLRHRFESEGKLGQVGVPVLMGHGKRDEVVPFWMNERLAKAAESGGSEVTRLVVEEAGHNDFFDVAEEEVDREAGAFLRRWF